ncbi:MAG: molybdopterin-binding protein, partial [Eggerthellaceae bacterium]
RDGNAYALAACAKEAGGIPAIFPIVKDDFIAIRDAVETALMNHDFVVTSGGASNGDYDFIKDVIEQMGALEMTLVNMRPGKAQAFGFVEGFRSSAFRAIQQQLTAASRCSFVQRCARCRASPPSSAHV